MLQPPAAQPRRSLWSILRPRISLRLMLALVTIFCIWLGVHLQRTKEQARIARRLSLNSGTVFYDYMRVRPPQSSGSIALNIPAGGQFDPQRRSPAPDWLLRGVGEDSLHSVVAVMLRDCDHLRDLHGLPGLESIVCRGRSINDGDIEQVAKLRQLRELLASLGGDSELTDQSLERLARLPRLETLELSGKFSATGIATLARAPSLKQIVLRGCDDSVTPETADLFDRNRVQELQFIRLVPLHNTSGISILQANQEEVIVKW